MLLHGEDKEKKRKEGERKREQGKKKKKKSSKLNGCAIALLPLSFDGMWVIIILLILIACPPALFVNGEICYCTACPPFVFL